MTAAVDTLIVCGAGYVSGKEIMAITLAGGLVRGGNSVQVVSSAWNDGDFIARLNAEAISHTQLRLGFISATLRWEYVRMTAEQVYRWPGLLWRYARLLKVQRPHRIVHTNWHHVLLLWPLLRDGRDVLWLHEAIPDLRQHRVFFSRLGKRLRLFIAVSHAVARSLVRAGVDPEKVAVIHNGIPDPRGSAPEPSVPSSDVRLGIVGQVGAWKGHEDLIEAFAMVAGKHPSLTLNIYGKDQGPYQDRLKTRIAELGLTRRVTWKGFVKDRSAIYGSIDVCVVPSRSEDPLPTTAIEAGYWGLPVIATTCGGLPEIIEDGVNGLLVPAKFPAGLAAAIEQLAGDANRRARMGAAARGRMQLHFSEERFLGEFIDILFAEPCTIAS